MLPWFQSRALPWGPASRSSTVPVSAKDRANNCLDSVKKDGQFLRDTNHAIESYF